MFVSYFHKLFLCYFSNSTFLLLLLLGILLYFLHCLSLLILLRGLFCLQLFPYVLHRNILLTFSYPSRFCIICCLPITHQHALSSVVLRLLLTSLWDFSPWISACNFESSLQALNPSVLHPTGILQRTAISHCPTNHFFHFYSKQLLEI